MQCKKSTVILITALLYSLIVISAIPAAELEAPAPMQLTSSAFRAGGNIPRKYTCDENDVSPQLRWRNAPAGTRAFALIADDPDAPGGTWVHWVIYDLPANVKEIAESVPATEVLTNGAQQGINDFRKVGYGGPCPPPGPPHRYFFKLYALDAPTGLKPRATKQQLLDAIKNHILGEAELMGRYKR
jgi:hypothetical protein